MNALAHHFETVAQQRDAAKLAMWIFLATEVMFFGGLFAAYTVCRELFPEAFQAASGRLDLLLGAANTAILLTSSFTVALALFALRHRRRRQAALLLALTATLGVVFLAIKGAEYHHKSVEGLLPGEAFQAGSMPAGPAEIFFCLYFAMTGLHALHVLAGVGLMAVGAVLVARGRLSFDDDLPVELAGLYWHFVDIVWVFLFPLLYLVGPRP